MRIFVAVLMGLMLTAPGSAVEPVTQVSYLRAFWQGTKAYVKGELADAERAFRAALVIRPDAAAAHDNLGESLFRVGKLPEAAAEFQKAMETSDRLAKSRAAYNLGNTLVKQDKLEDAVAAYKKALRWNEKDEDARWNLNVVMRKLKQQKQQQKQDQKDKKDPQQGKSDKDKDKQQQGKSGKDKDKKQQQGKSDKDKDKQQQGKSDEVKDKQQQGKADKDKDKKQQGKADRPSPSSAVAGSAERGDASISKQDAERILRYFQEKERSQLPKRAPNGRTWTAAPGEQTW